MLPAVALNLLDSRSIMGDLGWIAYPKNGPVVAVDSAQSRLNSASRCEVKGELVHCVYLHLPSAATILPNNELLTLLAYVVWK
ncbi:ephrin type-A receptor 5 [Tachysurus ichikawai]